MSKSKAKKDERVRLWTFIVYPESAPQNWQQILIEMNIECIISPLHDKDLNADGEAHKKPHYHVLLKFDGNKSFEQIKEITDTLNSPIPQKVASAKGLVRYMIHLDNPEKYQYNREDIIAYGGADVADLLRPTSSSRYALISEMIAFVQENRIYEIADLIIYAKNERFSDWFPLLSDNSAYIMHMFIKSYRHKQNSPGNRDESIAKLQEQNTELLRKISELKKS